MLLFSGIKYFRRIYRMAERLAFDLVNHNILFSKLIKQNIPHFLLRWFGSYLSGRQQRVRTSQYTNMWMTLPSQNYYQNTPTPKCQLFLSNLLSWANENNMEINTTKTKEMILSPLAHSNLPTGTIDRVTSFKLLGLHIDSSLSWANHTTIIVQNASSRQ